LIKTKFVNKKAQLQPAKPELHKCAVWPTVLGYVKKTGGLTDVLNKCLTYEKATIQNKYHGTCNQGI
jgi:hypothetical protein